MKIKKYTTNTMPEAIQIIRKELGPEAVILQSKEVNHGRFFGLFKMKQIEVIAAIDPEPITKQNKSKEAPKDKGEKKPLVSSNDTKDSEILNEIKNLKKIIEIQSEKSGAKFSPDYELAFNHLLDQEVEPLLAEEIITKVKNQLEPKDTLQLTEIFTEMENVITDKLSEYFPKSIDFNKKIVQFIGPTGVGKTTTLAKLAAHLKLEGKRKVAFITTDTYRIAAIDQLKTYARILDVPLEVAYNAEDYNKALNKFSQYDVILVDTAGRNFREEKYVNDLKFMMGNVDEITTYLVLSLTSKLKDMKDIYEQFHQIPLTGVIFTKMDETTQYGSMLNIVLRHNIGVTFIANGQDVPDDLLHPKPNDISKMIAGVKNV